MTISSRWVATGFLLLGLQLALAADSVKSGLEPGKDLPGPFQVFSVTGPGAGRFHCPVCDQGVNPTVLVFARDPQAGNKALGDFLKKLDAAITNEKGTGLGGAVVFLSDGGFHEAFDTKVEAGSSVKDLTFTKAIVAKEDKVAQAAALAKSLELKNVAVGLAPADGPKGYHLAKDADVTVIFYNNHVVLQNYAFGPDQLTEKDGDKILSDVTAALAKVKKPLPGRRTRKAT